MNLPLVPSSVNRHTIECLGIKIGGPDNLLYGCATRTGSERLAREIRRHRKSPSIHSHPAGNRAPLAFVPVGTIESRPALQCRVGDGNVARPGGTLEGRYSMQLRVKNGSSCEATAGLQKSTCKVLQASLRDATKGEQIPGTEVPGYSQVVPPGTKTGPSKAPVSVGQHLHGSAGFAACSEMQERRTKSFAATR